MSRLYYINGKMLPEEQAVVPVKDRGFMYGDGVFETMRVYNGKVFRLEQHLQRLLEGLAELKFQSVPSIEQLKEAVDMTIRENGWKDARVKIVVTRGCSDTLAPADCPPTIAVTGNALENNGSTLPWTVVIVGIRRDESSPLSCIKSLNYLPSAVGMIEAREKGADEGILLNRFGKVAEGTTSNIFLVKSGNLVTPSIESGALPGITRSVVIEIAEELGIPVEERTVERDELFEADEVFATNATIGIKPIKSIDFRPVGLEKTGPITSKLTERYKELTQR